MGFQKIVAHILAGILVTEGNMKIPETTKSEWFLRLLFFGGGTLKKVRGT